MKRRLPYLPSAFALYLLVAIAATWPLAAQLSTHLAGFVHGDGYENAHHLWWFTEALRTGEPLFTQTRLGYPDGIDGVTLWAHPLQFFPAWALAFVLPLPAAANLTLLLTMAANGTVMAAFARWLLARSSAEPPAPQREGNKRAAAFIAGAMFMLAPVMQAHLAAGHAGLMVMWTLPLLAWALLRLRDGQPTAARADRRPAAATLPVLMAAGAIVIAAWGHTLQTIYATLPLLAVIAAAWLIRCEWRALARLIAASGLGAIALGVFVLPVAAATFGSTAYTEAGGAIRYSADLLAIVSPSFRAPLWSWLDYPRRVLGVNLEEGSLYPGLIVGLLAVAGWRTRGARVWLALAFAAWILSWGAILKVFDQPFTFTIDDVQSAIVLPWALVQELPGFSLARTPGRFGFVLAFALAIAAAFGARSLLNTIRRPARVWLASIAVVGLIALDYQSFWPLPTHSAAIPPAVAVLRESGARAAFDTPWDNLITAKRALYYQTAHGLPLIAGQVTRETPISAAKLAILDTFSLAHLRAAGADAVIVHHAEDADGVRFDRARAALGEPVAEGDEVTIFEVPPTDEPPPFLAIPFAPTILHNRADAYLYSPVEGWLSVTFTVSNLDSIPRQFNVLWDGVIAARRVVEPGITPAVFSFALPTRADAYHTVTLALDPPCPLVINPALVCRTITIVEQAFTFAPLAEAGQVTARYAGGITLDAARVLNTAGMGATIDLYWTFDEAITAAETRFVHLLDAAGTLVAQSDVSLGEIAAGEARADQVFLEVPPGDYRVMTGWYQFENPDVITPRARIDAPPGAADNTAPIGGVTVE